MTSFYMKCNIVLQNTGKHWNKWKHWHKTSLTQKMRLLYFQTDNIPSIKNFVTLKETKKKAAIPFMT